MKPICIALVGPTASGKSAAALAVAARWPSEIISVDSAQVYRSLDIGTAKPSAAERAAVPHHLIDIRDPLHAYSAAEFLRDAGEHMAHILARGKLALLVGGSMMYIKALLDGLDPLPAADAGLRAAIEEQALAQGWPALHAELARVDPATAQRLSAQDGQRIQRALEVFRLTGKPLSAWHQRSAGRDTAQRTPLPLISLEPGARAWLHQRIATRLDAMWQAGLLDEVRALRARGDLSLQLPSMRCVGYRQTWEALDQGMASSTLRERALSATRQLAKRQLTWLRAMPTRIPIACDASDVVTQVLAQVERLTWA